MGNQKDIQREFWNLDKAGRRMPDHPVVAAAFNPLADIVAKQVPDASKASVLDVGCGNGFLSYALEARFQRVVGLDFSEKMLEINPIKEKVHGSATEMPFEENSFDVVVSSHLLHHLVPEDREKTLREMQRVARHAIVSFEPNRNNPLMFMFASIKKEERMALEFTKSYMTHLFSELELGDQNSEVQGWIVPNKAPKWWIPVGQMLGKTPLTALGFNICTTGRIKEKE